MKILIVGNGTMGKLLAQTIEQLDTMECIGIIDYVNQANYASFDEINQTIDCIIDFSHPSYLNDLLHYAVSKRIPTLIATTNLTNQMMDSIKDASNTIPIIQTSNTSVGIQLFKELLEKAVSVLYESNIEIIEKHHNQKIDAPSGTAKSLIESIQQVRDLNLVHGRVGESKRNPNEIGVHAIRGGTIAGEHTVLFAGNDELFEIKHTALSKQIFIDGAIKAARYLMKQQPGLYTMKDVLQ